MTKVPDIPHGLQDYIDKSHKTLQAEIREMIIEELGKQTRK